MMSNYKLGHVKAIGVDFSYQEMYFMEMCAIIAYE
jgi:hypothetical protein